MNKIIILLLALFSFFLIRGGMGGGTKSYIARSGKVIVIDQANQEGRAYENGKEIFSFPFPILSGDDECPTGNGKYKVEKKEEEYFSRRYKVPMLYSLFFVYNNHCRKAIHEGDVPRKKKDRQNKWATHGCIHVEMRVMKYLYAWAEEKTTEIIIFGKR